jgi:hypothetical protein
MGVRALRHPQLGAVDDTDHHSPPGQRPEVDTDDAGVGTRQSIVFCLHRLSLVLLEGLWRMNRIA